MRFITREAFRPQKSSQNFPCFCLVLQLCNMQHLKPLLFQVQWVSLYFLWLFWFFFFFFFLHINSIRNSGLPWFLGCEAQAYAMFVFQFAHSFAQDSCWGGTRQGLTDQLQGQPEQLKSLSKDLPEAAAAQQGHGLCSMLFDFQIKVIAELKNIIFRLPFSLLSPQISTLG